LLPLLAAVFDIAENFRFWAGCCPPTVSQEGGITMTDRECVACARGVVIPPDFAPQAREVIPAGEFRLTSDRSGEYLCSPHYTWVVHSLGQHHRPDKEAEKPGWDENPIVRLVALIVVALLIIYTLVQWAIYPMLRP